MTMPDSSQLIALDIEADTSVDGLDPQISSVTEVALSTTTGSRIFAGPERALLVDLETYLCSLPPAVLVTWNGHAYDMPFLATRYRLLGLPTTLVTTPDATIPLKYAPLPGHAHATRARWDQHRHVDICQLFAPVAAELGVPFKLKPVARAVLGIEPIEEDRANLHLLTPARRARYATSDTEITLALAMSRLSEVLACLD
jgi:DNA polymerase elongation subunit (family B)